MSEIVNRGVRCPCGNHITFLDHHEPGFSDSEIQEVRCDQCSRIHPVNVYHEIDDLEGGSEVTYE